MLTLYGACAVTFMTLMYALESRGPAIIFAFAVGCVLSSSYGFLSGAWPFGVVELIWSGIAVRRYLSIRRPSARDRPPRKRLPPRRMGRSRSSTSMIRTSTGEPSSHDTTVTASTSSRMTTSATCWTRSIPTRCPTCSSWTFTTTSTDRTPAKPAGPPKRPPRWGTEQRAPPRQDKGRRCLAASRARNAEARPRALLGA